MKRFNFYHIIGLFAMVVCLSGCIYDKTVEWSDKETETNLYTLQLAVTTQTEATRAAGHGDETGTEAENYIDFAGEDYRVLLFNADGTYKATILPNRLTYTYKQDSNNTHIVEGLITEAEKPSGKFYVVVVANWKAYDGSDYDTFDNFSASTDALWQNGTDFNFKYQQTAGNSSTIWTPNNSANPKRLIPMFGMAQVNEESFSVPDRDGNSYITATIPMLRALAKVEVVDGITGSNNGFSNQLNSVFLSRYNTTGRLIPNVEENRSWGVLDTQVTKASLPEDEASPKGTILPFLRSSNNTWMAYIPEMALGAWKSDNRPRLLLNVSSSYSYSQPPQEAQTGMFYKWDSYGAGANKIGTPKDENYEIVYRTGQTLNANNNVIWGPSSGNVNGSIYADLTNCEKITISGSPSSWSNLYIRILYNRPSLKDDGENNPAKEAIVTLPYNWWGNNSSVVVNIRTNQGGGLTGTSSPYTMNIEEPYFHINSIKVANGSSGQISSIYFDLNQKFNLTADYQVDFCNYNNGIPTDAEGYDDILRNHIYRFDVRMNPQLSGLQVDYTVCPWDEKSTDIFFK